MPKWKIQACEPDTCDRIWSTIAITTSQIQASLATSRQLVQLDRVLDGTTLSMLYLDPTIKVGGVEMVADIPLPFAPTNEIYVTRGFGAAVAAGATIEHFSRGCRYLEVWDAFAAPEARTHTIAAFERVCPAHADDVPVGVMQWSDGNWKDLAAYLDYQRAWFRRLNHTEWLRDHPTEVMPPQIASYTSDPVTPGSVAAPDAAKLTGLARAYSRNKEHNARKNQSITIPGSVKAGIDTTRITWSYSGVGDARVLTVNCGGQLTNQQRTQAQSIADVQYGVGKVVVVA